MIIQRYSVITILLGVVVLAVSLLSRASFADFSFEEMEQLEIVEQEELLAESKKAAKKWDFDQAERLISEAEQKNYAPEQINIARNIITQEKAAQAEQIRQQQEQQRLAEQQRQQQSRSSASSASGGCSNFVNFSFDGPGAEHSSSIRLSGPSDTYIQGNGSSSVSAGADSGCVGGQYSFQYSNNAAWLGGSDHRSFSGSFTIPSSASYCAITITDGFGVDVYVSCN